MKTKMAEYNDFYWVPVLPKEMRRQVKNIPDKKAWPKDFIAEYRRLHAAFTAAKDEFIEWAFKDRHRLMNKAAKAVLAYLVRRLNFDTGRCDPSQETIAEELGMGLRSVGRAIQSLTQSGWIVIYRRGLTATNFYRLRVPVGRIQTIDADLTERRSLRMETRRAMETDEIERTSAASTPPPQQSEAACSDKPQMADQERPPEAIKPENGTSASEPLYKQGINQREGTSRVEVEVEVEVEVTDNQPPPKRTADVIDFRQQTGRHRRSDRLSGYRRANTLRKSE